MAERTDQRPQGSSASGRRRVVVGTAAAVVAALLVGGVVLDLQDDGGGKPDRAGSSVAPAGATPTAAAPVESGAPPLPVVTGFDRRGGWRASLPADANGGGQPGYPRAVFAPARQVLVYVDESGAVRGVRAGDGAVLWSWVPDGLRTAYTLALLVVDTPSGEYAVVVSTMNAAAVVGGRDVQTTVVDIAPIAPGAGAAQARRITVEGAGWTAVGTPTGVMLGQSNLHGGYGQALLIDPETGAQSPVNAATAPCPQGTCPTVPALPTSRGLVSAWSQSSGCDRYGLGSGPACAVGWTVGASWSSTSVAPAGRPVGVPLGVTDRHLVASWQTKTNRLSDPQLDGDTMFAVHDLATGEIVVQQTCGSTDPLALQPGSAQPSTRTSPSGRYLASGQVVFDLWERTGRCLTADETRRGVDISAVDDQGTVYGTIHRDGPRPTAYGALPVAVPHDARGPEQAVRTDVRSGRVELLAAGDLVPVAIAADGSGIFRTADLLATYFRIR